MNQMLAGVISHGTGKSAALGRPAAGKTGTTQEYRDAWFIGYTATWSPACGPATTTTRRCDKVTGGTLPAAIWRNFMLAATRDMPVRPLPSGLASAGTVSNAGEGSALDRLSAGSLAPRRRGRGRRLDWRHRAAIQLSLTRAAQSIRTCRARTPGANDRQVSPRCSSSGPIAGSRPRKAR